MIYACRSSKCTSRIESSEAEVCDWHSPPQCGVWPDETFFLTHISVCTFIFSEKKIKELKWYKMHDEC